MVNNRKAFLDILRTVAAVAVVVYHVITSSISNDPLVSPEIKSTMSAFASLLRWHVPVFFMITGYLWLGDEKVCTYRHSARNIIRFTLALFTFGYTYALMERTFNSGSIIGSNFLLSFKDVLTNNLWDHMWYLYSAIGVYLFLPAIKPLFELPSLKTTSIFVAVLFSFTVLLPAIYGIFGHTFPVSLPIGYPAFYVCMGGLISNVQLPKRGIIPTSAALVISSIAHFILASNNMYSSLSDLLIAVTTVSVFIIAYYLHDRKSSNGLLNSITQCSFGIYLIHPFFINLLIKLLHVYPLRYCPIVSVPLISLIVLVVSYGTILYLRRIKLLAKYLL